MVNSRHGLGGNIIRYPTADVYNDLIVKTNCFSKTLRKSRVLVKSHTYLVNFLAHVANNCILHFC